MDDSQVTTIARWWRGYRRRVMLLMAATAGSAQELWAGVAASQSGRRRAAIKLLASQRPAAYTMSNADSATLSPSERLLATADVAALQTAQQAAADAEALALRTSRVTARVRAGYMPWGQRSSSATNAGIPGACMLPRTRHTSCMPPSGCPSTVLRAGPRRSACRGPGDGAADSWGLARWVQHRTVSIQRQDVLQPA